MVKLKNKIVVVTGGAKGNGEGIAMVMAKRGAHVMLWDNDDTVFATAAGMKSEGLKVTPFKVDVTQYADCKKATTACIDSHGRIDILCNNAGVSRLASFWDTDDDLRDFQFNVNILGVWNSTKAVLPIMKEMKYGKIVNMSSVTGPIVVDEGMTAYATSKAAILGFTKALARDVAKFGINVNAVCPGYILTPMVKHTARESNPLAPEKVIDSIAAGVPLGRLGVPIDVGNLVAFLASDMASYITGTQVVIDGGSTLPETMAVGA